MAWIYLVESEALASLLENGLDQSPTVKTTDTLRPCFCSECGAASFVELRYGMTCELCQHINWESPPISTSFMAASPARILVLRGMEKAWVESEAYYFLKLQDLPEKSNQLSFSLKTFQPLDFVVAKQWGKSWPQSGMIVDGILYPLKKSAQTIKEKDGLCLPTPTTTDTGALFDKSKSIGSKNRPTLGAMAKYNLWPTPTVHGNNQNKTQEGSHLIGLATAVGGALNPQWVEWLMNYHLDWTELSAWATQWFRNKQKKHLRD